MLAKQTVDQALLGMVLVRPGSSVEEIIQAAHELKGDVIILARHGHTGPKHRIIGTTAERVVREAPCAVLIVPQPDSAFS